MCKFYQNKHKLRNAKMKVFINEYGNIINSFVETKIFNKEI